MVEPYGNRPRQLSNGGLIAAHFSTSRTPWPPWSRNLLGDASTSKTWFQCTCGKGCQSNDIIWGKDGFSVSLDIKQFTPEELNIKVVDNFLVVEGVHGEKEDQYGFVSRQFVRRYRMPDYIDKEAFNFNFSSDGFLNIQAPRKIPLDLNEMQRVLNDETSSSVSSVSEVE